MKDFLVVYFGGKSIKNKSEGENIFNSLVEKGFDVYFHQYNHWKDENIHFTLEQELEVAVENIKIRNPKQIVIVAKSLGTYASIRLINKGLFDFKYLVLMGIPVDDLDKKDINEYKTTLVNYDARITLIHNRNDTHGDLESLQPIIASGFKHELIVKESDDHRYEYPEDVLSILNSLN